jgi:predicted aldo/keto reductase-like oxidoreductase
LAKQDENSHEALETNIEKLQEKFEMMNDRLDNIDSIVTAVAERVMKQPVTMVVTCSHCGHKVEIALIGVEKPTK